MPVKQVVVEAEVDCSRCGNRQKPIARCRSCDRPIPLPTPTVVQRVVEKRVVVEKIVEVERVVERIVERAVPGPERQQFVFTADNSFPTSEELERIWYTELFERARGLKQAERLSGLGRTTLYRKQRLYGGTLKHSNQ